MKNRVGLVTSGLQSRRNSVPSLSGSLQGLDLFEGGLSKRGKKTGLSNQFKKRECIRFITDTKASSSGEPQCLCGRKKSEHKKNVIFGAAGEEWTPERCTAEEPTDAYGEIDFQGLGSRRVPYIRLSHDTDANKILKLMLREWNLEIPNLVISVTGGAKSFVLKPRLKEVFRRGLMKAANSTGAWIITGGTNAGVMKHVGEAAKEQQLTFGSDSKVNVLGIASWGIVDGRRSLITRKGQNGLYPATYRMDSHSRSNGANLDPNHTHFFLVDNGSTGKYGVEIGLRSSIEEAIMKLKTDSRSKSGAIGVPVVLLVLEGGPNTVKTMNELIKKKIPAVVVDNSGRAADVVAYAYKNTMKTTRNGKTIRVIDPAFEGKVRAKMDEVFGNSKLYEKIEEVVEDENMISIYRLDDQNNSQDIDKAILTSLLKANSSSPATQLSLALAWNRIDVATSEIFTEDRQWTTEVLRGPMITALLDDKPKFVELFLQEGLSMAEFVTPKILCQLYSGVPANSSIKPLLEREMKKLDLSAINMTVVAELVEDLMGDVYHSHYRGENYFLSTRDQADLGIKRKKSEMQIMDANEDPPSSERVPSPYLDVLIWATLCNRQEMAKLMWTNGRDPIASALMASKLLKSMAKKVREDQTITDISKELKEHAKIFEERATGVLNETFSQNETLSQTLLVREMDHFDQMTCLELAVLASDRSFIGHTACQTLLTRLWMGAMAMNTNWWRVLVGMFMPFMIFPIISFVPDERQEVEEPVEVTVNPQEVEMPVMKNAFSNPDLPEGEEACGSPTHFQDYIPEIREDNSLEVSMRTNQNLSCWERILSFYSAPFTKFVGNVVSYIVFIVLYGYIITKNFPPYDPDKPLGGLSYIEILLYFWILTLFLEEVRQVASQAPKRVVEKISVYFRVTWNLVDMVSLAAFFVAAVLRFFEPTFEVARTILALDVVIFIVRSLQIFSVSPQLGPKLVMIRNMLEDLKQFVIILLVFILAYGIASQAVLFPGPGAYEKSGWEILRGIVDWPYWQMYGELFLDEMQGDRVHETGPVNPTGEWLAPILLAAYMVFTNILLLNLLIAIFNYTFEKVQEESDIVWKFQRNDLVSEYHDRPMLAPPFIVFGHVLLFIRWIWRLCRCGHYPKARNQLTIELSDAELEQLGNWEFQAAENYTHDMIAEENNQLENRVWKLGDRVEYMRNKIDRLTENMYDSSETADQQPVMADCRPVTRDMGGLERRLGKLEVHMSSTAETLTTILELLKNNRAGTPSAPAKPLMAETASEPHPLSPRPGFIHHKARLPVYPQCTVRRFLVPDDKVFWKIPFPEYMPINYTATVVLRNPPWADVDLMEMKPTNRPKLKFNQLDEGCRVDRSSFTGIYQVVDGLPLNPMGRTGIAGRGLLGRFGPNHAADPIVTRWKRTSAGVLMDRGKKVLEFVAIQRRDNDQWAIPGGMVEPGQLVTQALKAEFGEEAMAKLTVTPEERIKIAMQLERLFQNGEEVYRGYVDDPRNTDNAWMETVAVNFHDETGEVFNQFRLQAGDDAAAVRWQRVSGNIPLFASHASILEKVARMREAAF